MDPSEKDTLVSMVMAFRMCELQSLLTFANKNKAGRKSELQVRNGEGYQLMVMSGNFH